MMYWCIAMHSVSIHISIQQKEYWFVNISMHHYWSMNCFLLYPRKLSCCYIVIIYTLKLLILLSSDIPPFRDTSDMMRRYSCSLYRPISNTCVPHWLCMCCHYIHYHCVLCDYHNIMLYTLSMLFYATGCATSCNNWNGWACWKDRTTC